MTEQNSGTQESEGAPPKSPAGDAISMLAHIALKALGKVAFNFFKQMWRAKAPQ